MPARLDPLGDHRIRPGRLQATRPRPSGRRSGKPGDAGRLEAGDIIGFEQTHDRGDGGWTLPSAASSHSPGQAGGRRPHPRPPPAPIRRGRRTRASCAGSAVRGGSGVQEIDLQRPRSAPARKAAIHSAIDSGGELSSAKPPMPSRLLATDHFRPTGTGHRCLEDRQSNQSGRRTRWRGWAALTINSSRKDVPFPPTAG